MNWKKLLAFILVFGAVSELLTVVADYRSGKLDSWLIGVEIGFILIVAVAVALWRSGAKKIIR
jgi:hypothetical protein